ncbi:MAG: hypothetical protein M3N14_07375, partial [Bacteroidota bacterium]|nr:hypothetical protein [Bacteroidota bacterium]
MENLNAGQPSAYDIVFPVFGGKMADNGTIALHEIYGTAFYIGNNFFVTCAHTIKAALEQGTIALGYQDYDGTLKLASVIQTEIFDINDSGIIYAQIPRAIAYPWLKPKLAMLNDVVSTGYAYGFDKEHSEVLLRSIKGHIVLVGYNHKFHKKPHYELSFHVPRGQS